MRTLIVCSGTLALAAIGALALTAAAGAVAPADTRGAIERSLDYIEREGFAWMNGEVPVQDGKGCVSCHHVSYGVWSLREAQRHGIERPDTRVDLLERRAYTFLEEAGCRAFSCAPLLLASDQPGAAVRALAGHLASIQEEDGRWRARGQFPTQRRPIEESDAAATMWALLAASSPGAEGAPTGHCRESAAGWLGTVESGESTEWFLARLLVGHAAGDAAAVESHSRRLLDRQNPDGGWSWRPDQASDAMTTGQAVYALAVTGAAGEARASLERGVGYLLATQEDDGTWVTDSKLVSTKPSEAKHYVYTYWGTTWAAIGLSRALDALADR